MSGLQAALEELKKAAKGQEEDLAALRAALAAAEPVPPAKAKHKVEQHLTSAPMLNSDSPRANSTQPAHKGKRRKEV